VGRVASWPTAARAGCIPPWFRRVASRRWAVGVWARRGVAQSRRVASCGCVGAYDSVVAWLRRFAGAWASRRMAAWARRVAWLRGRVASRGRVVASRHVAAWSRRVAAWARRVASCRVPAWARRVALCRVSAWARRVAAWARRCEGVVCVVSLRCSVAASLRRANTVWTIPDRHCESTRAHPIRRATTRVNEALFVFRAGAGRLLSHP
jgi:hypothetical protein